MEKERTGMLHRNKEGNGINGEVSYQKSQVYEILNNFSFGYVLY